MGEKASNKAITLMALGLSASGIGVITGAVIAYRKDKGFWGYAGYMLLGSIVGGLLVAIPGYVIMAKEINKNKS